MIDRDSSDPNKRPPKKRIVGVFQPHRYTRTEALYDEFTRAFYNTDKLIILPIYSAGENEIEGITASALCNQIKDAK